MSLGWAKVGGKVVCIKKGKWIGSCSKYNDPFPVYGETYTIREIFSDHIGPLLRLNEIVLPKRIYNEGYMEAAWDLYRFRPLITLEDDISMFTALTNMSPIERLDRMKEMMDQ